MPTFKPVGIDENSLFPDRVETRLSTTIDGKLEPLRLVANTVIHAGDSITAQGSSGTQYATGTTGYGYSGWSQVFSGKRLRMTRHAGVSGERTDQILARLSTDVLAYAPGYVVVECGINDIQQDIPAATIQANLLAIYTTLLIAGVRVIATTITPRNALTAGQKLLRLTVNRWIANTSATTPGMSLCDWNPLLEDPAIPHEWVADLTSDGTHPSAGGAVRMGMALADVINRLAPPVGSLANADIVSPNLGMTGTGGSKDASATGSVASSFALWTSGGTTGTAVASKVTPTDGRAGEKQRVVIAAGNDKRWYLQQQIVAPGTTYQPGEWLYAEAEVDLNGDWLGSAKLFLDMYFAGPNTQTNDIWVPTAEPALGYAITASRMVLRTPPFQVAASGVTAIQARVWFQNAGGTIDIARMAVYRTSAPA